MSRVLSAYRARSNAVSLAFDSLINARTTINLALQRLRCSTATLPEMQNPSPANDRNVVPSNSSMTSLYPGSLVLSLFISQPVRATRYITQNRVLVCRFTENCTRVCTQLREQPRLSLGAAPDRLFTRGSQLFACVGGTVWLPHIRLGVSDAFAAQITFVPR